MKTLVCAFLYNRKELLTEERGKPMFWDKVAGVYDLFENLYNLYFLISKNFYYYG